MWRAWGIVLALLGGCTSLVGIRDLGVAGGDAASADGATGDVRPADAAPPDGPDMTIQDVQADTTPIGTAVAVHGVVVTAVDAFGAKQGTFWIEEPGGGPYSGVEVFSTTAPGVGVGDLVDVVGEKTEFALVTDTTGRTLTEIAAPQGGTLDVTVVGTGTVPAPEVLASTALTTDAGAEPWEGVLIQVDDVRLGTDLTAVGGGDSTYVEGTVTGPLLVQSALTDLSGVSREQCFASLVGVEDYFFAYHLLPRAPGDLVIGSGCGPSEAGNQCSNGMDDDADGLTDCMDPSCAGSTACP